MANRIQSRLSALGTAPCRHRAISASALTILLGLACAPAPTPSTPPALPPAPSASAVAVAEMSSPESRVGSPEEVMPDVLVYPAGLKNPEGALYDEIQDRYLVSNINGKPTDADNNGFISVLTPQGAIEELAFIAGNQNGVVLNAPKGLALLDGQLYVADIDRVRRFDMASRRSTGEFPVPSATFVNDVAVGPDGKLYATDSGVTFDASGQRPSGSASLHRLEGDRFVCVIKSADTPAPTALGRPNGVAAFEGDLLVASHGKEWLHRVTTQGEVKQALQLPAGGLDGIVVLSATDILVSSWQGQQILRGNLENGFQPILDNLTSPADIAVDTRRLRVLVPNLTESAFYSIALPAAGVPGPSSAVASEAPAP